MQSWEIKYSFLQECVTIPAYTAFLLLPPLTDSFRSLIFWVVTKQTRSVQWHLVPEKHSEIPGNMKVSELCIAGYTPHLMSMVRSRTSEGERSDALQLCRTCYTTENRLKKNLCFLHNECLAGSLPTARCGYSVPVRY